MRRLFRYRNDEGTRRLVRAKVGVSAAIVSRILRRLGLTKLGALEPARPMRRNG